MSKLYNEEIKERFLDEVYDNEQTKNTLRNLFHNSELEEYRNEKDLYSFNRDEIGDLLNHINPHSRVVASSIGRYINRYHEWAAENGLRDQLLPLHGVTNEWYNQFVDKTKKIHWAEDELYSEIIEKLDNAQDQALLSLIFEGILGKGFSELKGILEKHINWSKNEITITRDNEEKIIKLSDRTMRYLDNAIKDNTYRVFNSKTGDYNEKELMSSDYLFKNVKSPRSKGGEPLSLQVFYNRMQSISERFEMDYLTPNSIRQSGINYNVYLIAKEKIENGEEPEIGYDELAVVGEKYNASKMKQGQYLYFNTHLIREYCNEQTLKELYDIDVVMTRR